MKNTRFWLITIIVVSLICLYLNLPNEIHCQFSRWGWQVDKTILVPHPTLQLGGWQIPTRYPLQKGLDLAGGSHLVFEADISQYSSEERNRIADSLQENITRRVDLYGVSESLVQVSQAGDKLRVIVELPGVEGTQQAINLIGQTASLDFRRQIDEATSSAGFESTGLSGQDLKQARVDFSPDTNEPVVALEFTPEGREKFAQITEEIVGQILAIYLDETPLQFPQVQEPIKQGNAMIKGEFDLSTAKQLSAQLNAGALPVSINLVEQRTVEATLGVDSLQATLLAGGIGLTAVAGFMIMYYGKWGLISTVSLVIYGLITFALYRLIPVTLTMPGIAGFLLSVGMAVDSNILIFERLKEELRQERDFKIAREIAFGRAWDSIKDANICTIIAVFVLFNPFGWSFLPSAGMVRGFALTLGLGVLVSLFTGIVVTRTLMRKIGK